MEDAGSTPAVVAIYGVEKRWGHRSGLENRVYLSGMEFESAPTPPILSCVCVFVRCRRMEA